MTTDNIKVFISYSHDSTAHEARVLALADRLRNDGIDALIDQNVDAPPEGWQLWMEKQIDNARYVLVVCSETYLRRVKKEESPGKGLGVLWEAALMYTHLYESGVVNTKFIPIVFESNDTTFIPRPLKPTTYYDLSSEAGYERLYRRLTDQPATPAAPLGTRRVLAPLPRAPVTPAPSSTSSLTPNLVHPYPLQANFTGRLKEREELTKWLSDDERPIYELVAMGGMGKSALTWYWLTHDVLKSSDTKLDGVMWWSFYEGESSFAKFVDEALKYVAAKPIDAQEFPTTYDRAQELRRLLQNNRVLFVLDGFERQLRDYAGMDAAYKADKRTKPSATARSCVDPITSRLIREIASGATRAKLLLTSRLSVSDLEDRSGAPLAGVTEGELKELSREDAIIFMRAQGITKGSDTEVAQVCGGYGYHALSLRLLSGLIRHDLKMSGDIKAAPRHDVHDDLIQRQHHVLERAYNALSKSEATLISQISAFRGPMGYEAISIFTTPNNERFEEALENLRVRGLLQRDALSGRYDLHPIIRHYAYLRLPNKKDVHTRLFYYFAEMPAPVPGNVESLEDLASVLELFHHAVQSERYGEALKLFVFGLHDSLFYRLCAYQTCIELLTSFFPKGEQYGSRFDDESAQAVSVNDLANSYCLSGQPRRALPLYKLQHSIRERRGEKRNLAIGLHASASVAHIPLGELARAEQKIRRGIELSLEISDEFREARGHDGLGRVLALRGEFDDAEREFRHAVALYGDSQTGQWWQGTVWLYRAENALFQRDTTLALEAATTAKKLKAIEIPGIGKLERDLILAEVVLGKSLIIEGEDLAAADKHLTEALTRCRRNNLVESEPDILLARARWCHAKGDLNQAHSYVDEALVIADRCEYRLKQADIHNFLAQLALDSGDRETARKEAEIAKERAWCDGPPYCYKTALDEAERMLRELGPA